MAEKPIRIVEVARLAGVSPSTISHVLNGKRPISAETRERVLKVIRETGYVPDWSARTLKTKRTGLVGLIASDITETFMNLIVRGVEGEFAENEINLLFASGTEFHFDLARAFKFLRGRRIDGLIVSYEITMKAKEVRPKSFDIPIVTINREIPGVCAVLPDNFAGGYEAADHLLSVGVRRPAMILGPRDRLASEDRKAGFSRRMAEAGITLGEEDFFVGDFTAESGERGTEALLARDEPVDGIFCANDYMAAGAINALRRRGIGVPDEIKVIGFDNRDFSAFWPVPISTFMQPLEEMGRLSARLLLEQIQNGASSVPERHLRKGTLLVRKSTTP